jgi:hypothetical protein
LVVDAKDSNAAEHRKQPRYRVHWRVAIVHEKDGRNEIFHGRTHDLSLNGASIYSDHNIFVEEPVTVLLAMPPIAPDQSEIIIEISSRMVYTLLASNHHQFRIGLHFLRFKADGRKLLADNLANRNPIIV